MDDKVAILIVVERGYLEEQAKLLIRSILKFYQSEQHDLDIFAFSPRKDHKPSAQTNDFLKQHTTHHFEQDLNLDYQQFPLINGHFGARFFEQNHSEYKHVMLLDTDTVFLNNFEFILNEKDRGVFIAPVDNKGVGITGDTDKDYDFWVNLYTHLGIELPENRVTTRVGLQKIWPYYNAGFVYKKNMPDFFTRWLSNFQAIYHSDIRSQFSGKDGSKTIFLEQVALALTAQSCAESVHLLPETMNYPIPFHPRLSQRSDAFELMDLVHVHYHRWFQHPGFLDHVSNEKEKQSEQYLWLKKNLPLKPEIDGPFKC